MFNNIDSEELDIMQVAMDSLMLFRLLLDKGYSIEKGQVNVINVTPGYVDISYGYEDNCQLEYDNGDFISEIIFKDCIEYTQVSSTDYDLLLSTDPDEDGNDITKWCITDPRIIKFYDYCKENNIGWDNVIFQKYRDLAGSLIEYGDPWSDSEYYESFASEDLSEGLVILATGCEFVNYKFVRNLFAMYDYCEEVVKGGYPK